MGHNPRRERKGTKRGEKEKGPRGACDGVGLAMKAPSQGHKEKGWADETITITSGQQPIL